MPSGTESRERLTRRGGQPPTESAPVARQPRPGVPLAGGEPQKTASGAGQCRSGRTHTVGSHLRVPVKTSDGCVLMPCSPKRARKLIERRDATPYWSHGIFCIRLNREPSARNRQAVVVGVDPGSKREGFCARSEAHDLLDIDADAKGWVGEKLENDDGSCAEASRGRKTPCRSPKRHNENHDRVPTGTRARWEWKLQRTRVAGHALPDHRRRCRGHVAAAPAARAPGSGTLGFSPLESRQAVVLRPRSRSGGLLTTRHGSRNSRAAKRIRPEENRPEDERSLGRPLRRRMDTRPRACSVADREEAGARGGWYASHQSNGSAARLHRANPSKGGRRRKRYGGTNKGGLKTGNPGGASGNMVCATPAAAQGWPNQPAQPGDGQKTSARTPGSRTAVRGRHSRGDSVSSPP